MGLLKKQNSTLKQRLATSYTSSLISITLVLFVLSIVGVIVINEHKISNYIKENIGFTIFLKRDANEASVLSLQKRINTMEEVKLTNYISSEVANERLAETLGKEYIALADGNPVPPSIEVRLKADYATSDNFKKIEESMKQYDFVDSIHYDSMHIESLNANFSKISFFLLGFGFLLCLISIVLIHNSIRLSIYSKRFLIKTMQLVGATNNYIRAPFIIRGSFQGLIGSVLAICMLLSFVFFLNEKAKEILKFLDFELLAILFLSLILAGILLSTLATIIAVNKYLKIHKDDLYI